MCSENTSFQVRMPEKQDTRKILTVILNDKHFSYSMDNKEICSKEEHLHYCYHCYHFAVICSVQAKTLRILAASSPALLEPCWHVKTAKLACWEGIPHRCAPPPPVLYLAHSKYPLNSSSLLREGLSRWLSGNESASQCRRCKRLEFNSWAGKIPWRGHGNLFQYSCLEKATDRGACRATVPRAAGSQTQ